MKVKEWLKVFKKAPGFNIKIEDKFIDNTGVFTKNDVMHLYGDRELYSVKKDGTCRNSQHVDTLILNISDIKECASYRTRKIRRQLSDYERGVYYGKYGEQRTYIEEEEGYCIGTREWEACTCGGDKSKCNFYKDIEND